MVEEGWSHDLIVRVMMSRAVMFVVDRGRGERGGGGLNSPRFFRR